MSEWKSHERFEPNTEPDAATRRRAALTVCRIAGDAAAARPVLEALGLVEPVGAS